MPPVARLIEEVRAGTIGRLRMLAIREHRFPFLRKVGDWNRFARNTGGTMVEKCCHFFDLMRLIIDAPSRCGSIASGAQDVNHLDERYDGETPDMVDNAYVIVDFEGGARALLDLCMFAEVSRDQEEIAAVGERGKVEAGVPSSTLFIGDRESGESRTEIGSGRPGGPGGRQPSRLDLFRASRLPQGDAGRHRAGGRPRRRAEGRGDGRRRRTLDQGRPAGGDGGIRPRLMGVATGLTALQFVIPPREGGNPGP